MGGYTAVWNDVYKCRAAIWTLNANEVLDTMKLELNLSHRIRMRHPEASEEDVRRLWARQHLGEELFDAAYGALSRE